MLLASFQPQYYKTWEALYISFILKKLLIGNLIFILNKIYFIIKLPKTFAAICKIFKKLKLALCQNKAVF